MATSLAAEQPLLASQPDLASPDQNDPFVSSSTASSHHRFSPFDGQLFASGPTTSPEQAKRALEAHLAETERRIQDTSRLGTRLVQERQDLADRLKEVEKQQSDSELTPELRQKIIEIEKEYNELGRETARAFLPKSRVPSNELGGGGSPYTGGDTKRSASPSKFESQGTSSPSKLGVPNRKQRNQPSNRVHDIEFVTEISTSLIAQLRHVQTQLAERDDELRSLTLEKSRLEIEAEGFNQRLRSLDESEHRYKDENWNLETQIHEFLAAAKEAADREKKLTQNLNILQTEKSAAQKELDDIKLSHAKLSEDHAAVIKHHDAELGTVKRSMTMAETERNTLQRKVEDLTNQNQELAKAVAHQRGRLEDRDQGRGFSDEDFETAPDNATPEHSPPPSPVKGTPRHSMLESETLKSSLHHAHRMIQSLKGNIHREKTEKLELKRMLQDARDELDARRSDLGSGNGKRNRKVDSREFKKPLKPGQLGGLRNSRSEVSILDDPNWEEDDGQASPSHTAVTAARIAAGAAAGGVAAKSSATSSDHFETAPENDTSDAFETANERATETEDFQTGVEDISGSDELTETEGGPSVPRQRPTPLSLTKVGNRQSFRSTASTSGDEYAYDEVKTPTAQQPQRLRLKVSRGGNRRSRAVSEEPQFQSSPASFANSSNNGTPQVGQSLFAELGDMSDEDDSMQGTPSRFRSRSNTSSRPSTAKGMPAPYEFVPPVPKLPMIDSSMMTEPWEPTPATPHTAVPLADGANLGGVALAEAVHLMHDDSTKPGLLRQTSDMQTSTDPASEYSSTDKHTSTDSEQAMERLMQDMHTSTDPEPKTQMSDAAIQWHDEQLNNLLKVDKEERSRPISASTLSDAESQYDTVIMDEKLKKFPSPPSSRAHTPMASLAGLEAMSNPLTMSNIVSEHFEPSEPESPIIPQTLPEPTPKPTLAPASLVFSSIHSVDTEPISPRSPRRDAVIIPRDESDSDDGVVVNPEQSEPTTPKATFLGSVFGWNKGKSPATPVIAEDETRQSPSDSPMVETPESQRPFKEVSSNPHERVAKKSRTETIDESSQTALTAEQIDEMMRSKRKDTIVAQDAQRVASPPRGIMTNLKARQSQESIGSVGRARSKMAEPDYIHDSTTPLKRPGSAGSRNNSMSSTHPPLPTDHKQVIAAAAQRSGSSGGGPGSMGPPLMPASAYKSNPSFRPRTPSSQPPLSPGSIRGGTTPRPMHSSGTADIHSPTRTGRSRTSSVSSFVSEIDTRFNMRAGMPPGIDPSTDPRMINAITQTMIGEYLWKYTRKAGRGTMSENRHRRYFWVHPYTRTLYWSDRDPSSAGRAELKAKSVPIEAVRVVTDDNPMPPGLHRKSLVIMTPGRSVKFTATTGQRHETWFNALSYLLLRTGEDAVADTDQVANGALTSEDVAEFNPGYGGSGTARPGPPSLSSYNSRTTRNESPMRKSSRLSMQPQLASTSSRPSAGTFSRLSSYWKPGKEGSAGIGSFSSRRSRHSISGTGSIYEASEVHDSAEDLREIIEKQDRESGRLENVRACCDGKHDVGHLHHSSTKSRHQLPIGPASASKEPASTRNESRSSVLRRTD
ncbi:uncharacterized protein LY89DRAFT_278438 [Mollisia scopiformis]|uniref:PH domain-containing protein n=1 Tax=Mollisia scopiformis TaxID=149040 RepID=A0A132BC47_MOLSC|nr:uncharacterized protein LY89DRAFT_278438 [Mollisia scopiformis]KUJ09843.1 hypothetical protein LY89DRAFT_278438 [Mollisia scopiformis]